MNIDAISKSRDGSSQEKYYCMYNMYTSRSELYGQLTDIAIKSRRDCKLSSLVVQSNRSASANVRVYNDGHALLTHNCLRSTETNARNPAWFEMGPSIRSRWHGPPDGSLEKGDKRITPLVKQNLHYLCRRGSVRYARLCPADLNGLGSIRLAVNTIACIDVLRRGSKPRSRYRIVRVRWEFANTESRRVSKKIAKDSKWEIIYH